MSAGFRKVFGDRSSYTACDCHAVLQTCRAGYMKLMGVPHCRPNMESAHRFEANDASALRKQPFEMGEAAVQEPQHLGRTCIHICTLQSVVDSNIVIKLTTNV